MHSRDAPSGDDTPLTTRDHRTNERTDTKVTAVELVRVELELIEPFRTAHGTILSRPVVLVRVLSPYGEGWGECSALPEPTYTGEWADGAYAVLRDHLIPRILHGRPLDEVRGHPMASAALRAALLDHRLRAEGRSLATHLGATRPTVPGGAAVGMAPSVGALLETVERCAAEGYRLVKLKIQPGWDVVPVRAVRDALPDVALVVDANGSYRLDDGAHLDALSALDDLGLAAIEQPLAVDRLLDHVTLTSRLRTPVALDETIVSASVGRDAIALGACRAISVKPARMGGFDEALTLLAVCERERVGAWVGGMLETGLGRAGAIALAACSGITQPGDLGASGRYYRVDVTAPFVLHDGCLDVPNGPGLGVEVLLDGTGIPATRELVRA